MIDRIKLLSFIRLFYSNPEPADGIGGLVEWGKYQRSRAILTVNADFVQAIRIQKGYR